MASKQTVARVYQYLAAAYPNQLMAKVEIFVDILPDIADDQLEAAARQYLRDGHTFPPNPGKLAQLAFGLQDLADGRITGPEAWAMLMQQIRSYGSYGMPELPPVVIKALEGIGGWSYLCRSENLVADRARFQEAFEIFDRRDKDHQRMLPEVREQVAKLADRLNQRKGLVERINSHEG